MRLQTNDPLLALGCGQFALSLLQVMFMFYYVKVYMNVFHVPQFWFNLGQVLFMIWNSVNDPMFGYLQDTPGSWQNKRTAVIKYFSPFLALSFVFMWIPWSTSGSYLEGIHLILSLFLYDAFFSCIGVAWSALFADSTKEPKLRVAALKYSQISILLSVNIIAITEKVSHSLESFGSFQVISVITAIISFLGLQYAGSYQFSLPYTRVSNEDDSLLDGESEEEEKDKEISTFATAKTLTLQVIGDRNFIAIIITNFIQTARSVAHMNFASTATDVLISHDVLLKGSLRLSLFYGILTLVPQILLITNERIVSKYGAFRLLMISYSISILSSIFYFFNSNSYAVMLFMFIDSVTVHSSAPLFNIIISDFIDDDAKRHNRKKSISSLIFSLNALFVKPAQSIAPVMIVYFLNLYGYQDYTTDKTISDNLASGMSIVLFSTPLVLGGLQLLAFKKYSLGVRHYDKREDIRDI